MGKRGPAPTPTHLLKLRGSWRGETNTGEPVASSAVPECPAWLDEYAREAWEWVTASLSGMGILSADDLLLIVALCGAWSDYRLADETLRRDGFTTKGKTGVVRHPMVGVKAEASGRLLRLSQQFGLSPSARSRISMGKRATDDGGKGRFFKSG